MNSCNDKVVIIGNGPSLKDFDFLTLKSVDSIGMNAAYRYWERINWYPNHYVCLDDQLIETHAAAIYGLIKKEKVKTAFLIAKILDYYPDLLYSKNVFYLESFHSVRQKRVANKGVPYIDSLYFKESDPSKVTTGAYSVRFAAHLGYKQITILGVDLRYVEILPEAKKAGDIKLVMSETPKSNPNYFFDDYQRAGDKFNIPNPATHDRNLHIASFEVLANDVVQFGWNTKIFNSNKKSVLYDKAILPYKDIRSFTNLRKLSAVVVPTTEKEIEQIERNLLAWDQALLVPSVYLNADNQPDLVFAFSGSENGKVKKQVLATFSATKYVKKCFDKIDFNFVNLDQSLDYYQKDYTKKISGRGYKSGPNEQFFELMNRLSCYSGFIFYMETDCVPLRQGWLDEIRALAEGDDESWIIGSYYRGLEKISERFALHLNGNALYRVGDTEFIDFVNQFWRPQLYQLLDHVDKRIAYDCFLSHMLTAADPSAQNVEWQTLQAVGHRFRATSVIQNISGNADKQQNPISLIRHLLHRSPATYLAHGMAFQNALNENISRWSPDRKEPFYWGAMIGDAIKEDAATAYDWQFSDLSKPVNTSLRLLMLDSTPIGHTSATGQLKQTFLGDWPSDRFLQIWETGGQQSGLRAICLDQPIAQSQATALTVEQALDLAREFDPDVIYFRPVDSDCLFQAAERMVAALAKPLVIHIMDDWPERLKHTDNARFSLLDQKLRSLLDRATVRLSICQAMSDAYAQRYGGQWRPLANGVEIEEFPAKDWSQRPPLGKESPFLIRYMGALADDMTYQSVKDVAQAVQQFSEQVPIRFEIYTMDWCRQKAERELGALSAVSVQPLVADQAYRQVLSSADALLIAYNFDPASIAYIGLSLANKTPECLATGVPLIAYGPPQVATIQYLKQANCAQVIDQRDPERLRTAILGLVEDFARCRQLGLSGRKHVEEQMSKSGVQRTFRDALVEAVQTTPPQSLTVVGPFGRAQKAHYDETDCIAQLFNTALTGKIMIDVGAHHGYAHAPFLDRQWQIFAFEPDQSNRAKLLDRLAKHKHRALVSLDTRCVGNQSQTGVSFFTSEQSTGISGLSAFHETHKESQKVDITTLTEFFQDRPMPAIDFLKIDTEGHDLFVLQGYPWERGKPVVIECEFEDTKTVPLGYTFHDLAKFLVDKGYTVYVSEWHPIIRYGIRHDWRALMRYPCELGDSKGWGNLLAFRVPIDEQALVAAVKKVLKVGAGGTAKAPSPPAPKVISGAFSIEVGPNFSPAGSNQWCYTHSDAKQKLWIAALEPSRATAGREFSGWLRIKADRPMTVSVSIGRHGNTPYEGESKRIELLANVAQEIRLSKRFKDDHTALKLQVEVVGLEGGGTALMTIEPLLLGESLAGAKSQLGQDKMNLLTANRLFREGDFSAALYLYLLLHEQRPMKVYADNALWAARKLGMGKFASVDELRQKVAL